MRFPAFSAPAGRHTGQKTKLLVSLGLGLVATTLTSHLSKPFILRFSAVKLLFSE
jgi:hypothetical protein